MRVLKNALVRSNLLAVKRTMISITTMAEYRETHSLITAIVVLLGVFMTLSQAFIIDNSYGK